MIDDETLTETADRVVTRLRATVLDGPAPWSPAEIAAYRGATAALLIRRGEPVASVLDLIAAAADPALPEADYDLVLPQPGRPAARLAVYGGGIAALWTNGRCVLVTDGPAP